MNTFHPAGDKDAGVELDRTVDVPLDDFKSSRSIEVLNGRLHDQQFYTRSLIESNIDALMMTDTRGVITDVNQQMVALTGRTRDELIGARCRNFFTNSRRADTAIARVLKEDRINDYELTVRSFDGTETVVSYNAATLRNRERTVQGVFLAARDVTESKRFERALVEKNFKLEQANVARAEYLVRAKAELLTPLQAVVSSSKALRSGVDGALSEAQQHRVDGITADIDHVLSLLTELIGMSTVETGIVKFNYEDLDIRSVLEENIELLRESVGCQVSVSVVGAVDVDVGTYLLDGVNIEQMLGVLLSNAVIASTDGSVTVEARAVPRTSVGEFDGVRPSWSFALPESGFTEFLEIRVSDSGIGISSTDLSAVFLPLRHGGLDAGWTSSGNGVGLAMVRLLSELQDGTVGVQSVRGEGSTFALWLPKRRLSGVPEVISAAIPGGELDAPNSLPGRHYEPRDENGESLLQHSSQELIAAADADSNVDVQALAEGVAAVTPPAGHATALVVEDDPKSSKLVRLLLEAEGFKVVAAPSAEEALDIASRVPLSLITLDIQLPGMDGWKFLLKLHDSPKLASIPVVVIAGLADMSMALSRGAAAVLEKPLKRVELQNSLSLLGLRPDRSHTRCILIVDEDSDTVDQVTSYLEEPAYHVESSATGTAAIADALELAPDLILINLMMEHLGGFKIVRALQNHESTQHIPVLVMSAVQITDEEQRTIDSDPFQPVVAMNKPDFNREALLAEIKRAIG